MTSTRHISEQELRDALTLRLGQIDAELTALKAVTINTDHKTLTNRAISPDTASIRTQSYSLTGTKELAVYYSEPTEYGNTRGTSTTIDASEETGETVNYLKQYRTITPQQLRLKLDAVIDGRQHTRDAVAADLTNVPQIVASHNHLVDMIEAHNNSITYAASVARI